MSAITNSTRRSKAEAPQPADPGTESSDWAGAPLRSTLRLLAVPAIFAISLTVFKIQTNAFILYGFAALFGLLLLVQLRKGPEALLAVLIIYMPLARLYAARIAPGLNGTNSLELLLIAVWIISAYKNQTKLFSPYPFTRMVSLWLGLALISVFTAMARIGLHPFIWN
ncbi:MAG: O-antigen polymerase, partial [Thiomonas sp. 13-66-29]